MKIIINETKRTELKRVSSNPSGRREGKGEGKEWTEMNERQRGLDEKRKSGFKIFAAV